MGLFNKKPKLDPIIEFNDGNDTLFKIIDCTSHPIKTEVIVSETNFAFIVADGVMTMLDPGRHRIFEMGGFLNLQKQNKTVKVIYISKTLKLAVKWGTPPQMRIKYQDPKIGVPIEVGAFGTIEFQVVEPKQFYLEFIANYGETYAIEDLQERIRLKSVDRITRSVRRLIQDKQLSYYDFDTHKSDLQYALLEELGDAFRSYVGLKVCDFFVENMNISQENEDKIREKYQRVQDEKEYQEDREIAKRHEEDRREDIRSQRSWELEQDNWEKNDIDRELRFQRHIHENEQFVYDKETSRKRDEIDYNRKNAIEDEIRHRTWEREEADRAERLAMAAMRADAQKEDAENKMARDAMRYDAIKSVGWESAAANGSSNVSNAGRHCRTCGSPYSVSDAFCPKCGAATENNRQERVCPSCNTTTSIQNAFCPQCGTKLK